MRRDVLVVIGVVTAVIILAVLMGWPVKKSDSDPARTREDATQATATDPVAARLESLRRQLPSDHREAIAALEAFALEFPDSESADQAWIEIAQRYQGSNNLLAAKQVLQPVAVRDPESPGSAKARERLASINIALIFSPEETPDSFLYQVQSGDTLYNISRKYETTVELLMQSNNLSSSLIKPGMRLKVVRAVFAVDVSKTDKILTLKTDQEILKQYPIAVGEHNSTPTGKFKIVNRIVNPVWYKTGAIVPPGSPENILGTRWLGLSEPGYGIHGTTESSPIQEQATQGCVRMRNEDVEELYIIVPVGTEVTIVD